MTHDELMKINEQIDDLENIADMLVIRKGSTNGDVIKAIFPNFEFYPVEHMSKLYSPQIKGLGTSGYFEMGFDLEWWNSPYKADKEGD